MADKVSRQRTINEILNPSETPDPLGSPMMAQLLNEFCSMIEPPSEELLTLQNKYENSFYEFTKAMWPIIEPAAPWVDGYIVQCECEHWEAVLRGDIKKLIINQPPRHGKPVDERALVLMASGQRKMLRDVVVGDAVITHKGRAKKVTAVYEQGLLPVLRIMTNAGRVVRAAYDHPFLTADGWKRADQLRLGDSLAVVSMYGGFDKSSDYMTDYEFRLAGYFIGDGATKIYKSSSACSITCKDAVEGADLMACAAAMGFAVNHTPRNYRYNFSDGARSWLHAVGIAGHGSYTKRVPEFVFRGSNDQVAQFVGAYFACDGYVSAKGRGREKRMREDLEFSFSSVSRALLEDVQHLLARLGIMMRLRAKRQKMADGSSYDSFLLVATSQEEVAKFADRIPVRHTKATRLAKERFQRQRFNEALHADSIVVIEPDGEAVCRCLSVDDDQTFTASDLVVHNSIRAAVAFCTWTWTQKPHYRFIYASYSDMLVKRDSIRSRDVILHEWYRNFWGNKFRLKYDRNTQHVFENTQRGFRFATTPGGVATGEGAEIIIGDDLVSAEGARSKAENELVYRFWTQTLGSRVNDPSNVARVLTMQRFNRADIAGRMIAEEHGYETLVLPFECERKRYFLPTKENAVDRPRDAIVPTKLQLADPALMDNRKEGELLWPERFSPTAAKEFKLSIGAGVPGQLQQRPSAEGGSIVRSERFQLCYETWIDGALHFVLGEATEDTRPRVVKASDCFWFQCADTAQTATTSNDPTAIGTFCRTPSGELIVYHIFCEHLEYPDQWPAMCELRVGRAAWDRYNQRWAVRGAAFPWPCPLSWQGVEPKSTGESLIQTARRVGIALHRLNVYAGDKQQRGAPLVMMYEQGMVYHLASGPWRVDMEEQISEFPNAAHDDIFDIVSYAAMECQTMALTIYKGDLIYNASVGETMARNAEASVPDVFRDRGNERRDRLAEPVKEAVGEVDEIAATLAALEAGYQRQQVQANEQTSPLDDILRRLNGG
jgi:hypothetical protein